MKNKKNSLCYLVGEGYLGSSIKPYLYEFYDVIMTFENHHRKTLNNLYEEIEHLYESNLFDEITVIYAAAPNKKSELEHLYNKGIFTNGIKKEYKKIIKLFKKLLKLNSTSEKNIKIVYFNTSSIFYKEQFQNNNPQYQYIKCNEEIAKIDEIYQLFIPYVYSDDITLKKPDSLYSRIKKGTRINILDADKKIPIISKDKFIHNTLEKLRLVKAMFPKIFNKVHSKYSSIDITLKDFQNKILLGRI